MGISLKKLALNEVDDFPPPPPPLPSKLTPLPTTLGKHVNLGRKMTPDVEEMLSQFGYDWHPIDRGYLKKDGTILIQFRNDHSSIAKSTKNPKKKLTFNSVGELLNKLSELNKQKKLKIGKPGKSGKSDVMQEGKSKYRTLYNFLYGE